MEMYTTMPDFECNFLTYSSNYVNKFYIPLPEKTRLLLSIYKEKSLYFTYYKYVDIYINNIMMRFTSEGFKGLEMMQSYFINILNTGYIKDMMKEDISISKISNVIYDSVFIGIFSNGQGEIVFMNDNKEVCNIQMHSFCNRSVIQLFKDDKPENIYKSYIDKYTDNNDDEADEDNEAENEITFAEYTCLKYAFDKLSLKFKDYKI